MNCSYRILALMCAFLLCLLVCKSPPPPKPMPPNLNGEYQGVVTWKIEQGVTDSVSQAVIVVFTQTQYSISTDTADTNNYNPDFCLCRSVGRYAVTDRILMTAEPDSTESELCAECDTTRIVDGAYVLEQPAGGIQLTRVWTEDGIIYTNRIALTRTG